MDDQHAWLFPLFVIVIFRVFDEPTSTLPNAKLPDSPKIRVTATGAALPVPTSVLVLVPLVELLVTLTVWL